MEITELEKVEKWVVKTFGAVECGDLRRTDRLIKVAKALASNPSASLPCALETWGETLGAYRLLANPAISSEQIVSPHWSQTYHEATQCSRTLLLADITEMDYSTHKVVKGLAPIGNSREDIGFSLHTVLAMNPQTKQLLGCLTQEPFRRELVPEGETKAQRKKRERESQIWERSVQHIGRVPHDCQWIYVADSGSDIYRFWQTCQDLGYDFALRVAQNRVIEDFHKALKTGCRIEQRFVQKVEALWKLVAILTPIALRLLLIGQAAQQTEDIPATQVVSQDVISVVIHLDPRHRQMVTAKQLWHAIARLGGYLDRTCDGPSGWQTLWKGWMRVMQTLEGVRFALHFSSL